MLARPLCVFELMRRFIVLANIERMVALFCSPIYFLTFFIMSLKLLDNEQVVCSLKKTGLIWITPVLLGFATFIAFSAQSWSKDSGFATLLFLGFLTMFVVEMIRRHRYSGYVTNKRIILHFGLFLHEREIRFEQLEGVNVERYKSIFWHQIQVNGTGGTSTLFDYAGNYDEFKNAIYEAKEKSKVSNQSQVA